MESFKEFMKENEKLTIMSDVDGVLLDFNIGFRTWLEKNYPKTAKAVHFNDWSMGLGKESYDLIFEYWDSEDFARGLPQIKGAKAGLNALSRDYSVHIVTAVPEKFRKVRTANLKGFKYDKLKLFGKGKVTWIINTLKPEFAIEDKPENVVKLTKAGIDVYYPIIPLTKSIGAGEHRIPYRNWAQLVKLIKDRKRAKV